MPSASLRIIWIPRTSTPATPPLTRGVGNNHKPLKKGISAVLIGGMPYFAVNREKFPLQVTEYHYVFVNSL
jgi:hypothetical protein